MVSTGDRINIKVEVTRICEAHGGGCSECEQTWQEMMVLETVDKGPTIRVCLCGLSFVDGKCEECYAEEFADAEGDIRRDARLDRKAMGEEA